MVRMMRGAWIMRMARRAWVMVMSGVARVRVGEAHVVVLTVWVVA